MRSRARTVFAHELAHTLRRPLFWFLVFILLLMSLFGTTMTAFALVGSTGKSYELGVGVYGLMASSSGLIPTSSAKLGVLGPNMVMDAPKPNGETASAAPATSAD